MPFLFVIDLEPVGINKENNGWLRCFSREMLGYIDAELGNAAEVRNDDISFHDTGKRLHETFGLA